MNRVFKHIKKYSKYYITLAVFLFITYCVGDCTIFDHLEKDKEIRQLKKEINYFQTQDLENRMKIEALRTNDDVLESYAREELLMVKPDEEVFIIN